MAIGLSFVVAKTRRSLRRFVDRHLRWLDGEQVRPPREPLIQPGATTTINDPKGGTLVVLDLHKISPQARYVAMFITRPHPLEAPPALTTFN